MDATTDPALRPQDDPDIVAENQEWRDALTSLLACEGRERVHEILNLLSAMARDPTVAWRPEHTTPYVNTVHADHQPPFPGDLALEERLASLMRWNALAMVARANQAHGEVGGHIAR